MPYYSPPGSGTGQSWKIDQAPVESPNGARTLFTLPNVDSYIASNIAVVINGQLVTHTNDFTESSATTVTLVGIPLTGDIIRLNYRTT